MEEEGCEHSLQKNPTRQLPLDPGQELTKGTTFLAEGNLRSADGNVGMQMNMGETH